MGWLEEAGSRETCQPRVTGVLAAAKILPLTKFLSHTEHIRKVIRRVSSTKTCRGFFLPRPPITSRRSSHAPRRRALGALSPVSSSSSLVETHLCQDVLHQRLPLRQRRFPNLVGVHRLHETLPLLQAFTVHFAGSSRWIARRRV